MEINREKISFELRDFDNIPRTKCKVNEVISRDKWDNSQTIQRERAARDC